MLPEKDIIVKGWEKLDDDVVIKDVATKGKHVNLCVSFLAQRNELTHTEAKNYFLQKVNAYVYRLLSNRQLYKAEHILTNIERVSKYVFYQIAAETSDHGLRDYIREHLARTVENYSGENGEERIIAANWRVYCLLKANVRQLADLLKELDSGYSVLEIETMSFNTFYMKDEAYRSAVSLDLFFKNEETEISPLLDKYAVWSYLLKNNIDNLVKIWIQINACLRSSPELAKNPQLYSADLAKIKIDIYDDPRFNERLRQLFRRWEINDFMISLLSSQKSMCRNEVLLNALATYGKFVDHERTDALQILRRLITTQTLHSYRYWLEGEVFQDGLIKHLVENRLFPLLDLSVVSKECLMKLADDPSCDNREELELYLALRELRSSDLGKEKLLNISTKASKYLLNIEPNFYDENHIVFLFEYFLNPQNTKFPKDERRFATLPHLRQFLARLTRGPNSSPSAEELLTLHGLPSLETIRSHLFRDINTGDEDEQLMKQAMFKEHGYIPHCNHPLLCEKYSNPVKLNYLHYIKQHRSSYALYLFYMEQLKCYSRISPLQINSAAKTAAEIALASYNDTSLVTHCIAFIEMLGVNSARTRAYIRCLNMVASGETETVSPNELVQRCESVIISRSWNDPDLLSDLEAVTTVCRANRIKFPENYLSQILSENNWLRFLFLVEYLELPQEQILELCKDGFQDRNIGRNVIRAIRYNVESARRSTSTSSSVRRRSSTTSRRRRRGSNTTAESRSSVSSESDIQSSGKYYNSTSQHSHFVINESAFDGTDYEWSRFLDEQYDSDLFATILLCSSEARNCDRLEAAASCTIRDFESFRQLVGGTYGVDSGNRQSGPSGTFANLLDRAVRRRWPLLAVLAAVVFETSRKFCWLTWLMVSIDYPYQEKIVQLQEIKFFQDLLEYYISSGRVRTLEDSLEVFYPKANFRNLTKYFAETADINFTQSSIDCLRRFLENATDCPLLGLDGNELRNFSAKLLTLHLDHNFESSHHQIYLLQSLIASDIEYFTCVVDFTRLLKISEIIQNTTVPVKFINFYDCKERQQEEFKALCERLIAQNFYKEAIELADLAELPKDSIIFDYWVSQVEINGTCDFEQYQKDMDRYHFPPRLLLKFYIYIANQTDYHNPRKYILLARALELIKEWNLYPSEEFDRDRLEYELALAYVKYTGDPFDFKLYHSHFFTTTFRRDQGVLYHTFLELKEVAGINDLTVSHLNLEDPEEVIRLDGLINRLLEKGDIVQALRYQAIFDQRPIDLHFIVFCMALAESLVSLYNLSKEERLLLNEDYRRASNRFERRTLRTSRVSQSSVSSPLKLAHNDSLDTSTGCSEFEEMPSKEKRDIFEAINGLGGKIKHGQAIAQRIVLTYRIAMFLDKDYNEMLKIRDPIGLLAEVIQNDWHCKLEVINDIVTAHRLSEATISDFLAKEIVTAVVRSKFYMLQQGSPLVNSKPTDELLWGYNIDRDFHLFLELAPNTTLLGNQLLRYCDGIKNYKRLEKLSEIKSPTETENSDRELVETISAVFKAQVLSLKKQNTIIVALLIKAHDCFLHECFVEGIVQILQRCKALTSVLSTAKSWSLIVKLLVGIGRYREMYYCFETLIKNDQFESLLGQFDEKHTNGLKAAIISYLHEHCPEQKEYFRLAALHFLMYKEIAELWETEAKSTIAKVISMHEKSCPTTLSQSSTISLKVVVSKLECTEYALSDLNSAMEAYMHAAENYLLDNKLNLAQKAACSAELVALQICLINQVLNEKTGPSEDVSLCTSVLNIKKDEKGSNLAFYVNHELSIPQALIIARNYDFEISWSTALYQHYVVNGETQYLEEYLDRMPLTDRMIESLVKTFQMESSVTPEMERAVADLVQMVDAATLKYQLASLLGLKRTLNELINGNSFYYLKDCDYGRNEHITSGS
ncbi:uncharacterized protein LOC129776604 [Toxorhynchites rutilus septentrionalis]|uniref:uncharacterized protein LOC129776604 n=1 Tax=Toxorhynchites rutilus septentrionalis TaxID=329112 RepID=UPI0024789A4C|nr:uncharacterized protein LOC129776604 [Toxorhynchites rutilus septentrionalis]